MPKLTPPLIKAALVETPNWNKKGVMIARTYEFKDFVEAMKFVNSATGRELNLRGVNARVVQAGIIRSGDVARKLLPIEKSA